MKYQVFVMFLVAIIALNLNSCNNSCVIENIEVNELLLTVANENSINYCDLLNESLLGDNKSITELSLLKFEDAVGYEHGAIIVDLIFVIGEEKYLKAVSKLNKKQKNIIYYYIDIGLEYGNNPKVKSRDFEVIFPNLYSFLIQ